MFSESFSSGYHCITSYSISAKEPREMQMITVFFFFFKFTGTHCNQEGIN